MPVLYLGDDMFTRNLTKELIDWKNRDKHSPLILRGARQVGKTSLIRSFAAEHFDHVFEINFEVFSVNSLGFITTVFPAAIAGAHFQTAIIIG